MEYMILVLLFYCSFQIAVCEDVLDLQARRYSNQELEAPFIDAVNRGDFEKVRDIFSSGVNVNARDQNNCTALICAAQRNFTEIVNLLIDVGANLDAQNSDNVTALMWAAANNHTQICKMLIDAGADVNIQSNRGRSALSLAAEMYNLRVVQLLLEKGAQVKVNMKFDFVNQNTSRIAENLQREVVVLNLLLKVKIEETVELKMRAREINDQIKHLNDTTADCSNKIIQMAATSRENEMQIQHLTHINEEVMKQVQSSSPPPTNYTIDEDRKFHGNLYECLESKQAAEENAENCRSQQEELKATLSSKNLQIENLTHIYADLTQILKDNINARDGDKMTPLIRAAEDNQASTVKALIDLGANLDLQDNYADTALILAASRNNTEICKMLLEAGADVNTRNMWGQTSLMYATRRNNIEMVQMLLAKGAQVNLADNDGYTALHWAAYHGNVEVAKLLVGHEANINVKDNNGRTPLKRALSKNQTEVANYLKSVGATE